MCQTIYANLKSGGRFVTINANVQQPPESYYICAKYGHTKSIDGLERSLIGINVLVNIPVRDRALCDLLKFG